MSIIYPDKETIAAMFDKEDFPELPLGQDPVEMLDMCIQALKLAIEESSLEEYKPLEEYIGYGKNVPFYHIEPELLKELNVPRVMITSDVAGVPLLVLRIITKHGGWRGEVVCNVLNATGFFAAGATSIAHELKSGDRNITEDERRIFIIRQTANMLIIAFDTINERIETMVNSFLEEVFWDWLRLWYECYAEHNSLLGYKMKRSPFKKELSKATEIHQNKLQDFWDDDSKQKSLDLKKMNLVLEYHKTYEHWKEMERLQAEGKNWHRYVKAGDMADVSDDLIDVFINKDDISGLALEHAARRARLFNIYDVSDANLEKHKQGIMASGYSRPTLFNYKREGEELLRQRHNNSQSNDLPDSLD